MYIPTHFEVKEQAEIFRFIKANSFGQLISTCEGRPFSTHLPVLLCKDKNTLVCHLAKQNPQAGEIEGQEVLLTLQGPHDYVSPSWYQSPGVPTWNYQAVHIYGRCQLITDTDALKKIVDALSDKYEAGLPNPWQADYNPAQLKAIVGLEITITEIQCKYKLSQNRSGQDRQQVIEALRAKGATRLARAMENN